jgi:uncharacterized membrane protein YbhN (UPF0104 family)
LFLTLLTIVLFIYYFSQNKEQFSRLRDVSFGSILLIVLGQILVLATNVFILIELLKMTGKNMSVGTSSRVIAYSSLINFFGFLQGGLGFRAIYLKRYFNTSIKTYTLLTILQYLSVFSISFLMIFIGLWLVNYSVVPVLLALAVLVAVIIFHRQLVNILRRTRLENAVNLLIKNYRRMLVILVFSTVQFFGSSLAYGAELSAVGAHLSLGALLIFTGVAQFAILVALTPGAIGIRESLLFLVQGIMAISTSSIILAGTIDRAVYFVVLLLITPFAIGFKKKLDFKTDKVSA